MIPVIKVSTTMQTGILLCRTLLYAKRAWYSTGSKSCHTPQTCKSQNRLEIELPTTQGRSSRKWPNLVFGNCNAWDVGTNKRYLIIPVLPGRGQTPGVPRTGYVITKGRCQLLAHHPQVFTQNGTDRQRDNCRASVNWKIQIVEHSVVMRYQILFCEIFVFVWLSVLGIGR